MIGFPIGLLYANAGEWWIHKHILHERGRRDAESMWRFHWYEHHRASRRHAYVDPNYERSVWGWHAQGKEALGVFALAAAHLPLLPVAPFFTLAVGYTAVRYYRVHKRGHQDPEWAREHLPWHYDHHMGPDQDANWCVTFPWFDHIMNTRKPYVGTEQEMADRQKRQNRTKPQPAVQQAA